MNEFYHAAIITRQDGSLSLILRSDLSEFTGCDRHRLRSVEEAEDQMLSFLVDLMERVPSEDEEDAPAYHGDPGDEHHPAASCQPQTVKADIVFKRVRDRRGRLFYEVDYKGRRGVDFAFTQGNAWSFTERSWQRFLEEAAARPTPLVIREFTPRLSVPRPPMPEPPGGFLCL